jgi:geranylgeranyl diphosphate synthase, type II
MTSGCFRITVCPPTRSSLHLPGRNVATLQSFDTPAKSDRYLERIDAALERYVQFDDSCPPTLAEAIRYAVLGPGKRLRPQLTLLACEACGGNAESALPAACAVEMIHTYSLVHDDLPAMDDDDLRRGRPTCHKVYGEATAILVGDALLARAFELLATEIRPVERAAGCCAILAQAAGASALVGGQAADLAAEGAGADAETLQSIHRRKTGALITASLVMGGIIADANRVQIDALELYGGRLGLAFQITDDLLDVSGREAAVGKRLAKDAARGKATYPRLLGVEASRERAAELIDEACGALAPFGTAATPLVKLAQFVRDRNR